MEVPSMSHGQAIRLFLLQRVFSQGASARRESRVLLICMFSFLLLATVSQPAKSQPYQVIHNFTAEGSDGATPYGGPVLDAYGNLYGTTNLGGSNADGT